MLITQKRAYFHSPGSLYLPCQGMKYLLYPLSNLITDSTNEASPKKKLKSYTAIIR